MKNKYIAGEMVPASRAGPGQDNSAQLNPQHPHRAGSRNGNAPNLCWETVVSDEALTYLTDLFVLVLGLSRRTAG
jgi:hypothetical protein